MQKITADMLKNELMAILNDTSIDWWDMFDFSEPNFHEISENLMKAEGDTYKKLQNHDLTQRELLTCILQSISDTRNEFKYVLIFLAYFRITKNEKILDLVLNR